MERAIIVRGRMVGPSTVELEEPVTDLTGAVEVMLRPEPGEPETMNEEDIFDFLRRLPPGTRTKEDIDRQIAEERASWDDR